MCVLSPQNHRKLRLASQNAPQYPNKLILILQKDLVLGQPLHLRLQRLEHLAPEIGHVVRRLGHLRVPHEAVGVDGEAPAHLPPGAALGGRVPDPLVLAQAVRRVQRPRVEGVPGRADAQAPGAVDVALRVDDHLDVPLAADLDDPCVRVGLRRVRDGDAVDLRVFGGEFGEEAEGLLGDFNALVSSTCPSSGGDLRITHMDSRSGGGRQ